MVTVPASTLREAADALRTAAAAAAGAESTLEAARAWLDTVNNDTADLVRHLCGRFAYAVDLLDAGELNWARAVLMSESQALGASSLCRAATGTASPDYPIDKPLPPNLMGLVNRAAAQIRALEADRDATLAELALARLDLERGDHASAGARILSLVGVPGRAN